MGLKLEDLPVCQPYITGCFEKCLNVEEIIEVGDIIQIFAPKLFYHKFVGQVTKIYEECFDMSVKWSGNEIKSIRINPPCEGFYWDDIIRIKKIKEFEDIEF